MNANNIWVMFAMFLFCVTKLTALICATIIIVRGEIWIGSALFILAVLFRITWTFIPNVEKQSVRDQMKGSK